MVDTPAETVTRSVSRRSTIAFGSAAPARNTCFAPAPAAAYGSPQALAWNIGTIGKTVSPGPTLHAVAEVAASACRKVERCVYATPLGEPVVPEV